MSPAIENVLLGVLANGLTALIAHFGRKVGGVIGHNASENNAALQLILQKAAEDVSEFIEVAGPVREEVIGLFLTSPESEAIVRQIFSSKLLEDHGRNNLESIEKEFLTSFSVYTGLEEGELLPSAKIIFNALIAGCQEVLDRAIDNGVLSAHEAKSTFRYLILRDELESIHKNLAYLAAHEDIDIKTILDFEKKYRQQVAVRHQNIIPPNFDSVRKVPIESLYVYPKFVTSPREEQEKSQELTMPEFLSITYRAVILGNPGGGKSTFTMKLCQELAVRYSERSFAGREVTPILVILRDYGAEKKTHNSSILDFIERIANSKYQIKPPQGAFEYLLLNGRAMLIFDGLDELLDTGYRQEISADVESFCNLYPSVPVLVTSREVGYEQAPLDQKRFAIYRLAPFDEDQVQEYVTKWFDLDADLTTEQKKQKSTAFLEESQIVPDLRSNPLMLGLMCNIYRGENYIPRNRPDVYAKCAEMLFERWDKSRGIHYTLPFEAHIKPAMMYLAYWIYSDESLQGGVTELSLISKATEYLCPRRFEDRDEAETAAREFIEFCRGRAWVFTDTGTTKAGERLYQFTHRTFLEYFTAAYLVRTHETTDELEAALYPKIAKREWDVVAQLAFQIKNRASEGAADKLLTTLIDQSLTIGKDEGQNILSFAARCLEFMIPSPKVVRDITTACIERCLSSPEKATHEEVTALIGPLLVSAVENRAFIANNIEKQIIERVRQGSDEDAVLALEIGLHLYVTIRNYARTTSSDVIKFWLNTSEKIFNECSSRIETLAKGNKRISYSGFYLSKIDINKLVEWHGIEFVFQLSHSLIFSGIWPSPANSLIYTGLIAPYRSKREKYYNYPMQLHTLEELGRILPTYPTPWLTTEIVLMNLRSYLIKDYQDIEASSDTSTLSSDASFGLFCLLAITLEAYEKKAANQDPAALSELVEFINNSQNYSMDNIRPFLKARLEPIATDKLQGLMESSGFTTKQQEFISLWVLRQISLVKEMSVSEKVKKPAPRRLKR